MAASKRANGVPSALVARQSLNDEELVSGVVYYGRLRPLRTTFKAYNFFSGGGGGAEFLRIQGAVTCKIKKSCKNVLFYL